MKHILNEKVLMLNKYWQAVNETTVQEALKQMYSNVATAIYWLDENTPIPASWDEWVNLPIREQDGVVHTAKIAIRAPTILVSASFATVPRTRPTLDGRGVADRDGRICQYTGEYAPDGNIDHVIPRDRGGKTVWTNVAWSKKDVNSRKGNRLNHEAGLRLIRKPTEPMLKPVTLKIKSRSDRPEWNAFLIK